MRFLGFIARALAAGAVLLSGCGAASVAPSAVPPGIAVVRTARTVADTPFLEEVAQAFYADHADEYDMLVLWGAEELSPSSYYYFPVKNDVPGLGDDPQGSAIFDHGDQFGSARLQGIIWMGPEWLAAPEGSGPRSALGILAQETGHRWGADVNYVTAQGKISGILIGRPYHWSFFLDTASSPMGGNDWVPLGDGAFLARPALETRFSALDLYLMGLVPAEEVPPLSLLTNLRNPDGSADTRFFADAARVTESVNVQADVVEVTIDQIIAVHGEREPQVGFNGSHIRQAWLYVVHGSQQPAGPALEMLEQLRGRWPGEFSSMTGGLSALECGKAWKRQSHFSY